MSTSEFLLQADDPILGQSGTSRKYPSNAVLNSAFDSVSKFLMNIGSEFQIFGAKYWKLWSLSRPILLSAVLITLGFSPFLDILLDFIEMPMDGTCSCKIFQM